MFSRFVCVLTLMTSLQQMAWNSHSFCSNESFTDSLKTDHFLLCSTSGRLWLRYLKHTSHRSILRLNKTVNIAFSGLPSFHSPFSVITAQSTRDGVRIWQSHCTANELLLQQPLCLLADYLWYWLTQAQCQRRAFSKCCFTFISLNAEASVNLDPFPR